jgi:hypothetical protein
MSSKKSQLRIALAFAALATLALAGSCRGFFPKATLQSIALQPPTPSFAVGYQQPMQAWGTNSDNSRSQLTSGVSWQLSDPSSGTVATIDPVTGTMTGQNAGTITVTASSQGLSGTTTATVVETVSSMTITPLSTSVTDDGTSVAQFQICGPGGCGSNDITSLVTLTAYLNGTQVGADLPCTYNPDSFRQECQPQIDLVTTGSVTYTILVTYAGYTGSAQVTASLQVNAPAQ